MDPSTWGPKLWNVIFDICWSLDNVQLNKDQKFAVKAFFSSLQYLLPCRYCRESYCTYLKEMVGAPVELGSRRTPVEVNNDKSALRWAFDLKNKVNDKLKKRDRIKYEKVVQRMKTYQSCASVADVIDFLFIVGVNYMSDKDDCDAHTRKKAWFWVMIRTLPIVLNLLPQQHQLAKTLIEKPATPANVQSKDTVIRYLCQVSHGVDGRPRNSERMCRKYLNAQNSKKSKGLMSSR